MRRVLVSLGLAAALVTFSALPLGIGRHADAAGCKASGNLVASLAQTNGGNGAQVSGIATSAPNAMPAAVAQLQAVCN